MPPTSDAVSGKPRNRAGVGVFLFFRPFFDVVLKPLSKLFSAMQTPPTQPVQPAVPANGQPAGQPGVRPDALAEINPAWIGFFTEVRRLAEVIRQRRAAIQAAGEAAIGETARNKPDKRSRDVTHRRKIVGAKT